MQRKRLLGSILLIVGCGTGWIGYRAMHQSALDHDLILASATGNPGMVQTLLNQGADANAMEDDASGTGWRYFLKLLLHRKRNSSPLYPLIQAMAAGELDADRVQIVRMLLEHHANPNVAMSDGTPLPMRALANTHGDNLLTLFLQHGANPNTVDAVGTSLLMAAVNARNPSQMQELLEHGAKPDLANASGNTPLMWAAYRRDVRTIKLLLSHSADVNRKDKNGQTALTYALASSEIRRIDAIERLLAAGADVNAQDRQGWSPFLLALSIHSMQRRDSDVDGMMAQGADVRRAIPLSAPTHTTSVEIRTQSASMTLGMTFSAIPGTTPLIFAVQTGDIELVRKMLAKGADVNARDSQGSTALTFASSSEIRALLLRAGARP